MLEWIIIAALVVIIVILGLQLQKFKIKSEQTSINRSELEQQVKNEIKNKFQKDQNELQRQLNELKSTQQAQLQIEMETQLAQIESKYQKMDLEMAQSRAASKELEEARSKELVDFQKKKLEAQLAELEATHEAQIASLKTTLQSWKNRADAAMKSYQQLFTYENKDSINRLKLTPIEQHELVQLRTIINTLSNPTPFHKATYEIYYKSKAIALTNLVVGLTRVSGIYKITHIESGRCYVGQSVDLKARWLQHIKRGCGAEPPTGSRLYPAMLELGIENFAFEIIETVTDTTKLNELKNIWQAFYKAIEFGFSSR